MDACVSVVKANPAAAAYTGASEHLDAAKAEAFLKFAFDATTGVGTLGGYTTFKHRYLISCIHLHKRH